MAQDDFKELEHKDSWRDLPTVKIPQPVLSEETPIKKPEPRRGRKTLKVLAIVASFLILIIVLLPKLIPTGWIKKQVIKEIKNRLDRDAQLKSVSLGWFFNGININGLTIYDRPDNLPQSGEALPFVRLKRLELRATIFGLMAKTPKIKKLVLVEPEVFITRYENGKYNFSDLIEKKRTVKDTGLLPGTGIGPGLLGCLTIQLNPYFIGTLNQDSASRQAEKPIGEIPPIFARNTTIHYQDKTVDSQLKVEHLNIDWVPSPENKRDYHISITGLISSNSVPKGEVDITGDINDLFAKRQRSPDPIGAKRQRLPAGKAGSPDPIGAKRQREVPRMRGSPNLIGDEQMQFNKEARSKIAINFRKLDLKPVLSLFRITLPDISIAPLNGVINLETEGRKKALLSGELAMDSFMYTPDPDAIPLQIKDIKLTKKINWSKATPESGLWEKIDFQGTLNINEFNYGDIELKELSIPLSLTDKYLNLKVSEGSLNQGAIQAEIGIDFNQDNPPGRYKIQITQAKFSQLLTAGLLSFLQPILNQDEIVQPAWDPDGPPETADRAETTFSVRLDLTGQGLESSSLMESLNGQGEIVIEDGRFHNLSVLTLLADELDEPRLAEIKFDRMKQVFEIRDKRIWNQPTDFSNKEAGVHLIGWTGFDGTLYQVVTFRGELEKGWDEKIARTLKAINESGGVKFKGNIQNPEIELAPHLLRQK